ncbi:cyclopropane-fatty-acyl-phospholipid synthase family protein [Shinella curvata]|uniref:Cyclopropane-fatty-acyl-phospholipid synthase family protein n=1 Tax=Shinella curvata TaxID=1817964 RepID=A0ABT8XLZ4_9HYPH|nr:cyclopropane-fatty-acyl-phospholipid synthase family protein [Shinella curvata]MCJ8055813.1 cyclopropane-fatty-acyl-phospholipid synthase family protein [Shinella curvata]MDO6124765.1 cyclopropane-fatty-acyl-phospholipid synthase family protein [Shinella curvata]
MNFALTAITAAERLPLPDQALRFGISQLVGRTRRLLADRAGPTDRDFARSMSEWPIAVHTDDANAQHYELPAAFFSLVLGPRRKYSSCLYASPATTLAEAEVAALEETCLHADLADGQDILELGCGWGSLSLFMAERFPSSRIVCVSNSSSQRSHIEVEATHRGLRNLTVITADMNMFSPVGTFDRIVSVEMFEHMSNWHSLLKRARGWIRDDGRLFLHVFSHRKTAYRFDHADKSDWIAQHFFTGGVMPSHGLVREFGDSFTVEQDWRWNGRHYERTARDWLDNFDQNRGAVRAVFEATYGKDAAVWMRRWRMFFLATAGLFGHADGEEWGVSHYRLIPADAGR